MNYLFDLDGTLTDPVVGITRCIQHALEKLGQPTQEASELMGFIGPPLGETFKQLLATEDQVLVSRAIGFYRERFVQTGMFENVLYPDVVTGLTRLAANGDLLWVVTSKPHVYASQILNHFGITSWFQGIYGSELDGSNSDKRDLVRMVLDKEYLSAPGTWMVGDRAQDISGGRANGTRTIGVLWGYGSESEIRAEGPDVVITSMRELPVPKPIDVTI